MSLPGVCDLATFSEELNRPEYGSICLYFSGGY
jgi:hypothetical protein